MPRGAHRKAGAPGLPGAGSPRKYQTLRVPIASGRSPIAVDNTALAQLPALLLLHPEAGTVEGVIALAVRRLAAATGD